mgnify:CR=1 FL=1|jgi:hypothetical protein
MSQPVLSIGIKCHRDIRIFKTLSSIDLDNVDVIVALTPHAALERRLSALKCRVVIVPVGSLSVSSEACINNAICDKIVLTDSDTSFGPGYLKKMLELLNCYDVVKGKFIEDHSPFVIGSKLVSNYREYVHNIERPMFMPGLAINRQIAASIGGYIFNTNLTRGSDYDFALRVKANNIRTYIEQSVFIRHEPENILHDLVSAWITGTSTYNLNTIEPIPDGKWFTLCRSLLTILGIGRFQHYWYVLKEKGFFTAVYHHLWTSVFLIGYNWVKLKRISLSLNSKQ